MTRLWVYRTLQANAGYRNAKSVASICYTTLAIALRTWTALDRAACERRERLDTECPESRTSGNASLINGAWASDALISESSKMADVNTRCSPELDLRATVRGSESRSLYRDMRHTQVSNVIRDHSSRHVDANCEGEQSNLPSD